MDKRVELLNWMKRNNIRAFKDFARIVSSYADKPDKTIEMARSNSVYDFNKEEEKIEDNFISKGINEVVEDIDEIPSNPSRFRSLVKTEPSVDRVRLFHIFFQLFIKEPQ